VTLFSGLGHFDFLSEPAALQGLGPNNAFPKDRPGNLADKLRNSAKKSIFLLSGNSAWGSLSGSCEGRGTRVDNSEIFSVEALCSRRRRTRNVLRVDTMAAA